jgi:hypothetical protein
VLVEVAELTDPDVVASEIEACDLRAKELRVHMHALFDKMKANLEKYADSKEDKAPDA